VAKLIAGQRNVQPFANFPELVEGFFFYEKHMEEEKQNKHM
jgi:hypothetical protein